MSNLGFQTVVGLLSGLDGGGCHRAFADFPRTLEAGRTLREYDVVALSLSFEGDYPAALRLLRAAGVPLRSAERGEDDPLVLAGGTGPTLNPESLAPFLDVVLLGEAEAGLAGLHSFLVENRRQPRGRLLENLAEARLPGVYVPSRYQVLEERGVVLRRASLGAAPEAVERVWVEPPWEPARTRIWTPGGPFRGAYLLEVSRGCPHGCLFCAAGYATRPARFLPVGKLEPWLRMGAREFGRVGLVGSAISDHPELDEIGEVVLEEGAELSVSSFRVEQLDEKRLNLLVRGGLKTLTMAVEAGTERLRRAIGKTLGDDDLVEAARLAGETGIQNLRIYAMVGLPTETDDDIRALAEIAARARKALGRGTLTVSVAPFVPKPHTPLQWQAMAPEALLRGRIRLLARTCGSEKGVRVVAEAPKWARVQGLLARGGREVAPLLEVAAFSGDWRTALRASLANDVLDRQRDPSERLPWDFVTGVPDRDHLLRTRASARQEGDTTLCRPCSASEATRRTG